MKSQSGLVGIALLAGLLVLAAAMPSSAKASTRKKEEGEDDREAGGLRLRKPIVSKHGQVIMERGKRYLVRGLVPPEFTTEELTEAFEGNHILASLNYSRIPTTEGRGFQVVYTSPSNWRWDIPGEIDTLRFPNRIISVEQVIES